MKHYQETIGQQRESASSSSVSYAAIQSQLLEIIGKAGDAAKVSKDEKERQKIGQLTRRLCYALTGF